MRLYSGYHKCLTIFFKRVSRKTAFWENPFVGSHRHFFHRADEFFYDCTDHSTSALSGHRIDLDRFDDIRVVHIVRDPRDLVVSGYHYHLRAAEPWCDYLNPTAQDWAVVNAEPPETLPAGVSFTRYLNAASVEAGIEAEFAFRRRHLEAMQSWPTDDPRVLTLRYEDILGAEAESFDKIYAFFGAGGLARPAARLFARRYSAAGLKRKQSHIRNAKHGQWAATFTRRLRDQFNARYTPLLEKYDYPR